MYTAAQHLDYPVLTCLVDFSIWNATAAVTSRLPVLMPNKSNNLQLNPTKDMYINKTELLLIHGFKLICD